MAVPKQQASPAPQKGESAASTAHMVMQRLNEINGRLRVAEERINNNRERLRVFDDDLVDTKKKLNNDNKDIDEQIGEIKKSIKMLEDNIQHIIKELELTAKKQEIEVIEKYVNMMDPTRYVTKDEVVKLIERK